MKARVDLETAITCNRCRTRFRWNTVIIKIERCKMGVVDVAYYHSGKRCRPKQLMRRINAGYVVSQGLAGVFQEHYIPSGIETDEQFREWLHGIQARKYRRHKWTQEMEQRLLERWGKVTIEKLEEEFQKNRQALVCKYYKLKNERKRS
jgi:hypothetical protein